MQKTINLYHLVKQFHKKYQLKSNSNNAKLQRARIRHMQEELNEYKKAIKSNNRTEQLDALLDLVYVALGTAYYENFKFNEAFKAVHNVNMKKVRKATKRSKWDVVKPKGWKPADLRKFI